jgi:hypothetical protein
MKRDSSQQPGSDDRLGVSLAGPGSPKIVIWVRGAAGLRTGVHLTRVGLAERPVRSLKGQANGLPHKLTTCF